MKFTKLMVEDRVNTFREQIIKRTGIPIEEIEVVEESFNYLASKHYTIMSTSIGKIFVDPKKNHDSSVNLERIVLHELGHRAGDVLSPNRHEMIMTCLSGINNPVHKKIGFIDKVFGLSKVIVEGNLFVPRIIDEGIAEFFGLDVFSDVCDLKKDTKIAIDNIKWDHLCLVNPDNIQSRGYNFFVPILTSYSPLRNMVNYLTNFSSAQVPRKRDFANSESYWIGQGIKYNGKCGI